MEKLTPAQQQAIKKASSVRLMNKLVDVGEAEEKLMKMDRAALMELWAGYVAAGKGSVMEEAAAAAATLAYDPEVERQRLALQEQELQFRREELAAAEQHRKEELEEKRRQEEKEEICRRQQWERKDQIRREEQEREDRKRMEDAEAEMERIRLSNEQSNLRHREEADERKRQEIQKNRPVNKAKLYGNALKASMNMMPEDSVEVLSWFRDVEAQLDKYETPQELRAMLIRPYLTRRAKTLVSKMEPSQADDYPSVRAMLLRELKLSLSGKISNFGETRKRNFCFVY